MFEFSHPDEQTPHLGEDEFLRPPAPTAETILLIGQSGPDGTGELQLSEGFGIVHRSSPELPSLLWINGQQWGEFEPSGDGNTIHTIKLRWTQKDRVVSAIEAEINDQILKDAGGFSLAAPKVQFGVRGRFTPTNSEFGDINCLNVLQLTYSNE